MEQYACLASLGAPLTTTKEVQLRRSTQDAALYSPLHFSTGVPDSGTTCVWCYEIKSAAFLLFHFVEHSKVSRGFELHVHSGALLSHSATLQSA